MNENPGIYEPGRDITGRAKTAVVGRRFLAIAGDRDGGNISVAHATAAGRICGVSKYDAPATDIVGIARGNSRVTFVATASALAAFDEVEVGAEGKATKHTSGTAVGYAVTSSAENTDAEISLY